MSDFQPLEVRIAIIVEARKAQRVLRFGYRSIKDEVTWRIVDPDKIIGLYLQAWCLHRTEFRHFHLMRMRALRIGPPQHEILLPLPPMDIEPPEDDQGWSVYLSG